MYAEGRKTTIWFTGVTMKKPAGNGRKVFNVENAGPPVTHAGEGEILSEELVFTTEGQPKPTEAMFVNIKPVIAPKLAKFYVTNCTTTALNGTDLVTGSVKGRPEGRQPTSRSPTRKHRAPCASAGRSPNSKERSHRVREKTTSNPSSQLVRQHPKTPE